MTGEAYFITDDAREAEVAVVGKLVERVRQEGASMCVMMTDGTKLTFCAEGVVLVKVGRDDGPES